jgi:uncharacterized protein (TIGR02453 family)
MSEFDAFSPSLFTFLRDLRENNNRDWFNAHKDTYEADVREPARAFVRAMAPHLMEWTPHLVADDRKVGGSIMRVYRDTRFSKDKTPYKTNVGIQFRHSAGKSAHAPGLYIHLSPGDVFVGGGMWMPPSGELKSIRGAISTQGSRWQRIVDELPERFERHGDKLKRGPKGFDLEDPMIEELKWKSFIAVRQSSEDDATTAGFVDRIVADLRDTSALMGFLCEAIGQPF